MDRADKSADLTAIRVAETVGGRLAGPDRPVARPCSLRAPVVNGLAFAKTVELLAEAGSLVDVTILIPPEAENVLPAHVTRIVVDKPRLSFARALEIHFSKRAPPSCAETARIHPTAFVSPTAVVGEYCVIGPRSRIGDGTILRHQVVIGPDVEIGRNSLIKSGAVIGEEGFGFERDATGQNVRIPHFGGVAIGDYVEIGASTVVCSGTLEPTRIGDHTKLDDLVFVAHNVEIGTNCLIIAHAEISGSVKVGDGVWIGPHATINNKITIGTRAYLGTGAVVVKDAEPNTVYAGVPAKAMRPRTEAD